MEASDDDASMEDTLVARPGRGGAAHHKARLLSIVLLGLVAVVGAVGALGLVSTGRSVDAVVGRGVPAYGLLVDEDRYLVESQVSLERAFQSTDADWRYIQLERSDRNAARAREAWDDYRQMTDGSPQEDQLAVGFETIRDAWHDAVDELAGLAREGATLDDPEVAALMVTAQNRFEVMRSGPAKLNATIYSPIAFEQLPQISSSTATARNLLGAVVAVGLVLGFLVSRSSVRVTKAQQATIESRDAQRAVEARHTDFESRLHRALEMAKTEDAALDTMTKALIATAPDVPVELLLADSSRAHLRQALTTDHEHRGPGCQVPSPQDCPAVNRGQTLVFETNGCFDACPHFRDRPGEPRSAVCVPVNIMGVAAGVLHATDAPNTRPDVERLVELEQLAAQAGERIGLLRAFSRSEAQAATDPLTGLSNRRSLEERVEGIIRSGVGYAVAYGDLDHFKRLNDLHGHETGDRSLRLFARVLRESVRPDDHVARWGGEEFVVVLPSTSAEDAAMTLDRVRGQLANTLASGTAPPFTVSFGVCASVDADDFESTIAMADRALSSAKRSGRNCVVVAGQESNEIDALERLGMPAVETVG